MRSKITLPLIAGGLPLLAYPGVFVAGIMSLAGAQTGGEPSLLMAIVTSFLVGSMAYPLVYIPCAITAVRSAKKQKAALAFRISMVPLVFLAVLAVLFLAWAQLET